MAGGNEWKGADVAVEGDWGRRCFLLLIPLMEQKNPGSVKLGASPTCWWGGRGRKTRQCYMEKICSCRTFPPFTPEVTASCPYALNCPKTITHTWLNNKGFQISDLFPSRTNVAHPDPAEEKSKYN